MLFAYKVSNSGIFIKHKKSVEEKLLYYSAPRYLTGSI